MLTRRDILRGMGGWSAMNAARIAAPGLFAAGLAGCQCRSSTKINVMLHGLFVLNITDGHVQLLTPQVDEHIYKVGFWNYRNIKDLCKNDYVLEGVTGHGSKAALSEENVVLSTEKLKFDIDRSCRYFEIIMPLPEKISFLRSMKGANLYRGKGIHATGMAICTMLTYCRSGKLRLRNSTWDPNPEPKGIKGFLNVHIWAEPQTRVSPLHTIEAYYKMMCFFKPRPGAERPYFAPSTDDSPPLDHPEAIEHLGLIPEEEMGWAEWETDGEGSRPTNCNTVVVTSQPVTS
jgi:hypothetical protein